VAPFQITEKDKFLLFKVLQENVNRTFNNEENQKYHIASITSTDLPSPALAIKFMLKIFGDGNHNCDCLAKRAFDLMTSKKVEYLESHEESKVLENIMDDDEKFLLDIITIIKNMPSKVQSTYSPFLSVKELFMFCGCSEVNIYSH